MSSYRIFECHAFMIFFTSEFIERDYLKAFTNIGITHVFTCINICRVQEKLFEHEAVRPSVHISFEGPGKC